MTGIVGWIGAGQDQPSSDLVARMLDAGHSHDGSDRQTAISAAGGAGAQGWPSDISAGDADGTLAVVFGRPRWKEDKYEHRARDQGAADSLIAAWRDCGDAVLDQISGPASFAIVDTATQQAMIAVDRVGVHQLAFAVSPRGDFVFGSDARAVCAHPAINPSISRQALFNYLYFYISPGPQTVFENVEKLQPGQAVQFRNGTVTRSFYWQPAYAENTSADAPALAEETRRLLSAGVASAASSVPGAEAGAFLSGGLDSTSVAGYLAGHRPGAKGFTIAFPEEKYNELPWAETGARQFGVDHIKHVLTPDETVAAIPGIINAHDEPYGNSSSVPAYICARIASDAGVDILLAGDGGDEIFAGNERYIEQRRYDAWYRIPAPLRNYLLRPALSAVGGNSGNGLLGRARAYAERASTPLPDRLQAYNVVATTALVELFHPDFLGEIDPAAPLELTRAIYNRPADASELKRMQFLDLYITLADNDLRKVNRACELAGIRVAYPMLDEDLFSFAAGIPTDILLPDGRLRGFYKDAMAGFLPGEILNKSKHGFGMPFAEWTHAPGPLRDMAGDALNEFGKREILAPDLVAGMRKNLTGAGESPFGGLVWDIMMLELWLAHHASIATLR